jgi:hypothetical protein
MQSCMRDYLTATEGRIALLRRFWPGGEPLKAL